jgi:hypothetical protein
MVNESTMGKMIESTYDESQKLSDGSFSEEETLS